MKEARISWDDYGCLDYPFGKLARSKNKKKEKGGAKHFKGFRGKLKSSPISENPAGLPVGYRGCLAFL